MKRYFYLFPCSLALLLAASAVSRADVNWSYTTSMNNNTYAAANFSTQTGSIVNSSNIGLLSVWLSNAGSGSVTLPNGPSDGFKTTLSITSNGATGTVAIAGTLVNNFLPGAATYTNSTSHVAAQFATTSYNVTVGGNNFLINLTPLTAIPAPFPTTSQPLPNQVAQSATIQAVVTLVTGQGPPPPPPPPPPPSPPGNGPQAPEPSTMLLSFLGLSGFGAAAWRKTRKSRTVAALDVAA